MVARRFYRLFRHVLLRIRAVGRQNLHRGEPVILVSNHVGSFGPISVMSSLRGPMHPWVACQVTEVGAAAERIRVEFTEGELHLKPPLSRWVARVLGRICVALMRDIGAIPVYDRSRRIRDTMAQTIDLLERGRSILIFPEDAASPRGGVLCDFRTGFVHVARAYFERTRKAIAFLPIAVHRGAHAIRIGTPIAFDARAPFAQEKQRVKREVERTIYRLYSDLERGRTA